ncbi:MAG: DUF2799 domain-containing protein [Burkholderiaceae bacterium]|nr:DUF2799 domain-containing protein [Burkholderiaceae bacterium]
MKTRARNPLVTHTLAAIAVVAALVGCATPADNKDQCLAADWRTVGYEDGLRGAPADRIGSHRVACGKHGVTPDLAAYLDGRERGLQQYCQPRSGFRVGVNGNTYADVCAGAAETAFIDAYRQGCRIYDARAALRTAQSQLRSARQSLVQTDSAMTEATAELVSPKVPTERRTALAADLVRLTQQRTALSTRIEQLSARTQELASNVQVLERQSPYTL